MGVITGNQAKLQIGQQSDWSTITACTQAVEFVSETMQYKPGYMTPDYLVGRKTAGRMDIAGIQVEGDVVMIVTPDNVGLLIAAVLGAEVAPAQVDTSAAYDHVFTPMSAVAASSLPKLSVKVDRIEQIFGYIGCKIEEMKFASKPQDYLRATFTMRGYDESTGVSLESLSYSTLKPLQFKHGTVTVDAANYADVTSIDFDYKNNLDSNHFTLGSGDYMAEIEPQMREITMQLQVEYSSATDSTRTNKFKTGDTIAIVLTFTSDENADTGVPYSLTFSLPLCYITDASPNVSGPNRIMQTLAVTATEDASNQACTVTVRDANGSAYLS